MALKLTVTIEAREDGFVAIRLVASPAVLAGVARILNRLTPGTHADLEMLHTIANLNNDASTLMAYTFGA